MTKGKARQTKVMDLMRFLHDMTAHAEPAEAYPESKTVLQALISVTVRKQCCHGRKLARHPSDVLTRMYYAFAEASLAKYTSTAFLKRMLSPTGPAESCKLLPLSRKLLYYHTNRYGVSS